MPFDQFEWLARLRAVEREYLAAKMAIERFSDQLRANPTLLQGDLRQRDFVRAAKGMEGTYVVRLFAEFESALRKYWTSTKNRRSPSQINRIMRRLASACRIGDSQWQKADEVREYRNSLVHERDSDGTNLPIATARKDLCIFIGRLR